MGFQLKSLAKQTAIYGLPSIVGRFLNFLLVPLYTYSFAPDEYGIVTEFYAYMALLLVVLTYGMETTFFRFMQKYRERNIVYSTGMLSLLFTSSVFFALVFVFKDSLGAALSFGEIGSKYIVWFSLILLADVMSSLPFCLLRQENKALRFAMLKICNICINIGLNLFFILYCPYHIERFPNSILNCIYSPQIGVGYIFISNLIASLLTFALLFPEWRRVKLRFSPRLWNKMMSYALPIMIWGFAGVIDSTFDRILLRHLTPDATTALSQLGIYGACYKLSVIMTLFVQAFRFAAEPFFFKHSEESDAKITYAKVMSYFVITCSFIYMICVLFLDQLLYFIGEEFRVGAKVVPILLMGNLFLGVFYNLSVWYKVIDRTKVGMYISLIGAALNLGLNFLLIPHFGYMGAAITLLSTNIIICIISYFWGQKAYKVPYNIREILLYIVLVVLVCALKSSFSYSSQLISVVVSLLIIMVFLLFVVFRERELRYILLKKLLKNVKNKGNK